MFQMKTVAFSISHFDGVIKQQDQDDTHVDHSCKLSILSGAYNESNIRASEDSLSEKFGREVASYKISHEQFETLKDVAFPCMVELDVDYVNGKMNVLEIMSVQPCEFVVKQGKTSTTKAS